MVPEGSLSWSQEPAICPSPEPDQSTWPNPISLRIMFKPSFLILKNKSRLMQSSRTLYVCVSMNPLPPPINFWMPEPFL
jgi:hypothetical protein